MVPDEASVRQAIEKCRTIGEQAFLDLHASGRRPQKYYLVHEGRRYPRKAIWAAAHKPPIHTRQFTTEQARKGLERLGFR
jgi:hypothetical protein